jgi:hypothetical protein
LAEQIEISIGWNKDPATLAHLARSLGGTKAIQELSR